MVMQLSTIHSLRTPIRINTPKMTEKLPEDVKKNRYTDICYQPKKRNVTTEGWAVVTWLPTMMFRRADAGASTTKKLSNTISVCFLTFRSGASGAEENTCWSGEQAATVLNMTVHGDGYTADDSPVRRGCRTFLITTTMMPAKFVIYSLWPLYQHIEGKVWRWAPFCLRHWYTLRLPAQLLRRAHYSRVLNVTAHMILLLRQTDDSD